MEGGLSWATCDHLRNLMFKVFTTAKKWNFFLGQNPALGVELPENNVVREKHALTPSQILQLLALLKEPCRSMVLLGLLTGLRVGEILGAGGNRFDLRPVAGRADHLSWNDKLSQNPRQPTHLALTSTYSPNLAHVIRAGFGEIRPGPCVLDEQRHATQRHQPATSRAEACGPKRSVLPGSAGIRCGELMPRCYKWRAVRSRMLKHG
jgi:integrase